jgi:hypothetical protein
MKLRVLLLIILFLLQNFGCSALVISEIQFDPDGSDTNREWVEVYNDGATTVDFSTYKFFEAGVNHGLAAQEAKTLAPGEYAVVVQDYAAFVADYPSSTVKLFKSSFSLSNTGEALSIKNSASSVQDSYTYSPSTTGSGAGLSEQRVSGVWGKGVPTPGSVNAHTSTPATTTDSTSTSTATSTATSSASTTSTTTVTENVYTPTYYTKSSWPTTEKVYLKAGDNRIAITGKEISFKPRLLNGDKQDIYTGVYNWSLGDGYAKEGREITHTYQYPGEYSVTLEVILDKSTVEDTFFIHVIDPKFTIKYTDADTGAYSEITNDSLEILDIGEMVLSREDFPVKKFIIPKNTVILPKRSIKITSELTGFATSTSEISLGFKNGRKVASFTNQRPKSNEASTSTGSVSSVSVMTLEDFKRLYPEGYTQLPHITPKATETANATVSKTIINPVTLKNIKNKTVLKPLVVKTETQTAKSGVATTSESKTIILTKPKAGLWESIKGIFGN